jgi:hypothetical protein
VRTSGEALMSAKSDKYDGIDPGIRQIVRILTEVERAFEVLDRSGNGKG